MTTKSQNSSATMSDVKDDIQALREDVSACLADVRQAGAGAIRHSAEATRERARHAMDRAHEAQEVVHQKVSEHPMTAILIALGVGALASRLLFHRR